MNKQTSHDKLQVSTMSKTGKFSRAELKGAGYLTIMRSFNDDYCQLAAEVTHTTGAGKFLHEHPHPDALINITFGNASGTSAMWSGTKEELLAALLPESTFQFTNPK